MHPWPSWPPDEDERTRQALGLTVLAGRWAISGPPSRMPSYLDAAAARVAEMSGRRFAVLTSSGSAAIVLALQVLGVGPGSRVALPATTWVGCATAVLRTGAEPVYLDACVTSPCADAAYAVAQVDAVLAIHTYASQVDVAALRTALPGVPIVEDCSHSHAATTADGAPLGSLGDLSIYSFQATKVLPAGEGGAVVTSDQETAARLMALATDSRKLVAQPDPHALNRLEAARSLHGANHAMSEFSAAVLWAQLQNLPGLAARRTEGLRYLADQLDGTLGSLVFTPASAASGGFYGVPFRPQQRWRDGVEAAVEQVREACGARLDRVYPPIPYSPLYRPATVSTYRGRGGHDTSRSAERDFPNASRWHHEAIVLPHALFLAEPVALTALADALDRVVGTPAQRPAPSNALSRQREISVVVVTTGQRDTLVQALAGIAAQHYPGPCSILLLCDDRDGSAARVPGLVAAACLPVRLPVRTLTLRGSTWGGDLFTRVARLRNTALDWVQAPLIAFLDDDNSWEPEHLASLVDLMDSTGVPAVHSWRRLLDVDGTPHVPDTFPWLRDSGAAAARYALLRDAGVFTVGSDVVRDRASLPVGDSDYGMVDMGEWLFNRRLLDLVRFDTTWSGDDLRNTVGEDDKLLRRLRELLVPMPCTERPTLRYRLGGFTNGVANTPIKTRSA